MARTDQTAEYRDRALDEEFWETARRGTEPSDSRWFFPAVIFLLVLATPWYLPESVAARQFGGLPVWVWQALAGALSISGLTAYGAFRLWREDASVEGSPSAKAAARDEES